MSSSNDRAFRGEAQGGGDGDRARAKRAPSDDAGAVPRVVTTGGKNPDEAIDVLKDLIGFDQDTGERVQLYASRSQGVEAIRYLCPKADAPHQAALVDALAISLVPPSEYLPELWVADELRQFLPINKLQQRKGYSGFEYSATWDNGSGLIAWGGKSQRGRVYVSIQGQGCATIQDWIGLAQWLAQRTATIKRVDLAHDDFEGRTTDIAWAVRQYAEGGFNSGGRQPVHQLFGDWLSGEQSTEGRTFGVGRRANGKFCRIYEKGKQLGDPLSPWVRVEVEWRAERRHIPFDVLTQPGTYLAGAYPCLSVLATEQARIRTTANAASIAFDAAVENARQQSGKIINLMMRVYGGDYAEVVERLRRDGIPARIEPYGHALAEAPERLDSSLPGSFYSIRKTDDESGPSTQ
jgi:phage replication initiation protein